MELWRRHDLSSATYYAWKAKFGGLEVSDARRLRALKDENGELKRLLAEAIMDNAGLKDLLLKKWVRPPRSGNAVAHLQATLGMGERRAYRLISADRKSMRYRSCRADDGDLRSRLCELAQQRRRFGYRRLHILLRRDGITINRKKTQRLYREEGLTVRRRKGRRRAVGETLFFTIGQARVILAHSHARQHRSVSDCSWMKDGGHVSPDTLAYHAGMSVTPVDHPS